MPGQSDTAQRVRDALEHTRARDTARMGFSTVSTGEETDAAQWQARGEGVVSFAQNASDVTFQMSPGADTGDSEIIQRVISVGDTIYVEMPDTPGSYLPFEFGSDSAVGDAASWGLLELLVGCARARPSHVSANGDEPPVGWRGYECELSVSEARARGGSRTASTIDMLELNPGQDSLTVQVLLDEDDLVRRVATRLSSGASGSTRVTVELGDFGTPVDIQPPPADQLHDTSDIQP